MKAYIRYIFLGALMLLMISGDDPPKKKTAPVDTTAIQKEQLELQMEQKTRMGKWDSLLLKQDTLIKKK